MAITYNDLTLDIRRRLRQAGIEAATLEARELVCFAAGKSREQLLRDGALYASPEVEAPGPGPGPAASGRGAGGLPHRRVGVLRPAPGHLPGAC